MTTISETDLKVFANLANPQKANISKLTMDDDESLVKGDASSKDNSDADSDVDDHKSNASHYSGKSNAQSHAPSHVQSHAQSHAPSFAQSFAQSYAQSRAPSHAQSNIYNTSNNNDSDVESVKSRESESSSKSAKSDGSNSNSDNGIAASKVSYASRKSHLSDKKSAVSNRSFGNEKQEQASEQEPFKRREYMKLPFLNTNIDEDSLNTLEKQQVLMDMERLKLQGIKLTKEWTINDRLDDMQFEVKRHMLHIDEMNNINMMRDGMRMVCSGFEMINTKFGFLELEGWANEVCTDMDKYDNALGRIYRKYWRRGTQNSPEMEIAMGLIGSMGMYHFKKKMQNNMFGKQKQTGMPGFPFPGMSGLPGMGMPPDAGMRTNNKNMPTKNNTISDSDSSDEEDLPP